MSRESNAIIDGGYIMLRKVAEGYGTLQKNKDSKGFIVTFRNLPKLSVTSKRNLTNNVQIVTRQVKPGFT